MCLDTQDTEEIIRTVQILAPAYGGINLEDIAAPRCFEIEARLREMLDIPVFHDDQHGTAIVVLGALRNALRVVGKRLADCKVVVCGVGAAGSAIIRAAGPGAGRGRRRATSTASCTRRRGWTPTSPRSPTQTNPRGRDRARCPTRSSAPTSSSACPAPNLFGAAELATMASDAIVFALANPDPEVDPRVAMQHAAVVATGRSDYPNQINNVLAFPGVFRGPARRARPRHHRQDAARRRGRDRRRRAGAQPELHRAQRVRRRGRARGGGGGAHGGVTRQRPGVAGRAAIYSGVMPVIGVLALQGDVREHVAALTACGARAVPVRRAAELDAVDAMVLPGGESTTMSRLLVTFELLAPLRGASPRACRPTARARA